MGRDDPLDVLVDVARQDAEALAVRADLLVLVPAHLEPCHAVDPAALGAILLAILRRGADDRGIEAVVQLLQPLVQVPENVSFPTSLRRHGSCG